MTLYEKFCELAKAVEIEYGVPLIVDEDSDEIEGYHCPHCGEPVYFCDWHSEYLEGLDMDMCPICEEVLEV